MNDDEINEIIARSDEEAVIFHEIDVQRERDALENWRRAGNRGKPPPPLMQLEELPECYRTDEPFAEPDALDELEGRGHRRRTVVNYNDGLSDDQWALVSHSPRLFSSQTLTKSACVSYLRLSKRARTFRSCPSALVRRRSGGRRTR